MSRPGFQNIQELAEDLAQQQTKIRNKLKTSRKVKSAQNILTEVIIFNLLNTPFLWLG